MKKLFISLIISATVTNAMAQLSRVSVKSPIGSTWGITTEAAANKKLIGMSHDGSN